MYRTVEFDSTFPNEWRADEDGNTLGPGARELAEAIVHEIGPSMRVCLALEQHKDYGWRWDVEFEGVRFVNVLNPVDKDCYLTVELGWYPVRWLLGQKPGKRLQRYCAQLTEALGHVPQVSNVRWGEPRS